MVGEHSRQEEEQERRQIAGRSLPLRAERVVPLGLRFDGAEKRSQRLDDYPLVSADAPNGVCRDFVRKAVAAFLYFADRTAHSRPSRTTRPARNDQTVRIKLETVFCAIRLVGPSCSHGSMAEVWSGINSHLGRMLVSRASA